MDINLNPVTNPWSLCLSLPILGLLGFIFLAGYAITQDRYRASERSAEIQHAIDQAGIDRMTMRAFRDFVAALMERRGYAVRRLDGESDPGTTFIATRDGRATAVQAFRYGGRISRQSVRDTLALRDRNGCDLAMIIASTGYSADARALAAQAGCQLIDREQLAEWLRQPAGQEATPAP